eukprot:9290-Chlamydomonas_euryale.AAC.1
MPCQKRSLVSQCRVAPMGPAAHRVAEVAVAAVAGVAWPCAGSGHGVEGNHGCLVPSCCSSSLPSGCDQPAASFRRLLGGRRSPRTWHG